MTHRRTRREPDAPSPGQPGQSLTEFALVMPLLVALLVAIMLLAIVGFSYVSITSATRMGTRHLMSYPQEPADDAFEDVDQEILSIIQSSTPFINWDNAVITITPPVEDRVPITTVIVQIQYDTNLPTFSVPYVVREGSFFLLPPIILHAESRMRLE